MPSLIDMARASVWGVPLDTAARNDAPAKTEADRAREDLKAAGVKVHHKANDATVVAMHAAFIRSGLSGQSWNLLSDEDRKQYYEAA